MLNKDWCKFIRIISCPADSGGFTLEKGGDRRGRYLKVTSGSLSSSADGQLRGFCDSSSLAFQDVTLTHFLRSSFTHTFREIFSIVFEPFEKSLQ